MPDELSPNADPQTPETSGGDPVPPEAGLSAPLIEQRNDRKGCQGNHDEHEKSNQDCGHVGLRITKIADC